LYFWLLCPVSKRALVARSSRGTIVSWRWAPVGLVLVIFHIFRVVRSFQVIPNAAASFS
jgi:hypothetical protein